jgi:hypothetical protein
MTMLQNLKSIKLYRRFKGGAWAKLYGEWHQADPQGWIDLGDNIIVHMIYSKITEREYY